MRQSAFMASVRQFLKTTTLHGFKYLSSPHCVDRIGWLACCCASACCAGVLCAVLWARFQQVPALLILRDLREGGTIQTMPSVAICPPPETLASLVMKRLTKSTSNETANVHSILTRVINGKPHVIRQLQHLEEFFRNHSQSLPEVLLESLPACDVMMRKCRWQQQMIPCSQLFSYELTAWGVCCVMKPDRLSAKSLEWDSNEEMTKEMDLVIECGSNYSSGCDYFTQYIGQEAAALATLFPGLQYFSQVMFTAEVDADKENENGRCNAANDYSTSRCIMECIENFCGCSDPLLDINYSGRASIPHCTMPQLTCIKNTTAANIECNCLPRCKKVFDDSSLEASAMGGIDYTIDPLLEGIDRAKSIALNIRVRNGGSRFYNSIATENWITLLASLGGVFNMFLGVGLFSALEVLYLIFIRIPIAISKPVDLQVAPAIH